jgi:hypothetical protein
MEDLFISRRQNVFTIFNLPVTPLAAGLEFLALG